MAQVLIIDDHDSMREGLELLLRRRGHKTISADAGERGLALLEEVGADLVITDLKMAKMDGIQVLQKVRDALPGCGGPGHHRLRDHREGRGGHEAGGRRLHHQALLLRGIRGEGRSASGRPGGEASPEEGERGPPGGEHLPQGRGGGPVRGDRRRVQGDGGGFPVDRAGGPERLHGHDLRGVRYRERAGGPSHPRRVPAQETAPSSG